NDASVPFHPVKGTADVLAVASSRDFVHGVGKLLDRAESGQHPVGPVEIELVLKCVDLMTVIVRDLPGRAAGQPVTDVSLRRRQLMDAISALLPAEAPPQREPLSTAVEPEPAATASSDVAPALDREGERQGEQHR